MRYGVAVLLMTVAANAQAEIDIGTFKKSNHNDPIVLAHVAGLGTGLEWMQTYNVVNGAKPVFCPPENLSLNPTNYVSMLESYIAGHNPKDTMPLGYALLKADIETFPCK